MNVKLTKLAGLALFLGGAIFLATGCEPKGPAEQAGANLDNAGRNLKDAVTQPGPGEKAGRTVDKSLNK